MTSRFSFNKDGNYVTWLTLVAAHGISRRHRYKYGTELLIYQTRPEISIWPERWQSLISVSQRGHTKCIYQILFFHMALVWSTIGTHKTHVLMLFLNYFIIIYYYYYCYLAMQTSPAVCCCCWPWTGAHPSATLCALWAQKCAQTARRSTRVSWRVSHSFGAMWVHLIFIYFFFLWLYHTPLSSNNFLYPYSFDRKSCVMASPLIEWWWGVKLTQSWPAHPLCLRWHLLISNLYKWWIIILFSVILLMLWCIFLLPLPKVFYFCIFQNSFWTNIQSEIWLEH